MNAIILAAGKGKRLMPLTEKIPKTLIEITPNNKIIDFVIRALPEEINKIIIVINYLGQEIEKYIKEKYPNLNITFVKQGTMSGTYGALFSAKDEINSKNFLVLGSDDIIDIKDVRKIILSGRSMGVNKKIMPAYYGINMRGDFFDSFRQQSDIEKKNGTEIATGIYHLDTDIFNFNPIKIFDNEYGLPQMFAENIKEYPIKIVEIKTWVPVNNFKDLEEARKIYN